MLMPVNESYILQAQLISVERGSVNRSRIYNFFSFCQVKKLAGIVNLMLGSPVQGRLAGFPFQSAGYISLLFLLQKVGRVLVYCFMYACVMGFDNLGQKKEVESMQEWNILLNIPVIEPKFDSSTHSELENWK